MARVAVRLLPLLLVVAAAAADASSIVLYENFESADWQLKWTQIENAENTAVVNYIPNSGKALAIGIPYSQREGAALIWRFPSSWYPEPNEAWLRYYAYFSDSWQSAPPRAYLSSLPGFLGRGWAVHMYSSSSQANAQVGFHIHDMRAPEGYRFLWAYALTRSQWYAFEFRVKLNTPGYADGIVQGWLNNRLLFDQRNFVFRDDPAVKVEAMWGGVYLPTGTVADRDMTLYLDAITISLSQIAPSAEPAPPDPAP
jgi:hypothetical protein